MHLGGALWHHSFAHAVPLTAMPHGCFLPMPRPLLHCLIRIIAYDVAICALAEERQTTFRSLELLEPLLLLCACGFRLLLFFKPLKHLFLFVLQLVFLLIAVFFRR